ncbi:hypothetical protein HOLleu_15587 [Holothuria leucospilota]|uniref:Retrotransposon gag domain-containing protein n=1 Tax=Holothuria leucospilota TaxID=206669 RepID=A0A9Q1C4X7_HOLLE|nr:hypothetical protein HOLleu_15587 [Holothuria leucospilota]
MKRFEEYCTPKKNVTYERHLFFTGSQQTDEAIDQYATELKRRAKSCEFDELKEGLLRDRIVCGCGSNLLREKLLRTQDLTLDEALQMCRANEAIKAKMKTLTDGQETVAVIRKQNFNKERRLKQHKVNATDVAFLQIMITAQH